MRASGNSQRFNALEHESQGAGKADVGTSPFSWIEKIKTPLQFVAFALILLVLYVIKPYVDGAIQANKWELVAAVAGYGLIAIVGFFLFVLTSQFIDKWMHIIAEHIREVLKRWRTEKAQWRKERVKIENLKRLVLGKLSKRIDQPKTRGQIKQALPAPTYDPHEVDAAITELNDQKRIWELDDGYIRRK